MSVPAVLSVLFSLSLLAITSYLLLGPFFRRREPDDSYRGSSPDSPRSVERSDAARANAWLRAWQYTFVLLVLVAFCFHTYWALFAAGPFGDNPSYSKLKDARDQRNRRAIEAGLRGWIYDRKRAASSALAIYQLSGDQIVRRYPLDSGAPQLVGYASILRGKAGLEKAFDNYLLYSGNTFNPFSAPVSAGNDLVTTIDADLQVRATQLLGNHRGAVVVLDPRNGDVFALASSPAFSPVSVDSDQRWSELLADKASKPLLDRATSEYYLPGSTFKTVVAAAAITQHMDNLEFTCSPGGYVPRGASRPIEDDDKRVHGRIGLSDAFTLSCNQYFAQLGLALGAARLADEARKFGIRVDSSAEASRSGLIDRDIWNSKSGDLAEAFGPPQTRMVLSPKLAGYDLAIESFGQGFHQATVLHVALIAAAVASPSGEMVRPKLERDISARRLGTTIGGSTASRLRQLMARVVQQGTASRAFAGCPVPAAGKTGTAQFREIDPASGRVRTRIDAWFIGFAPVANPQIAFAIIVEDGGHGGAAAAPIARALVERAARTGLIFLAKTRGD